MADVKKIATRESYGNTLKELAAEGHEDLVVLDADLAAATKTGMFRKAYPDRHFDCGIAEGNMMGVAAGLSTMGYVPFVSSFAMFAAGRAFEDRVLELLLGQRHLRLHPLSLFDYLIHLHSFIILSKLRERSVTFYILTLFFRKGIIFIPVEVKTG